MKLPFALLPIFVLATLFALPAQGAKRQPPPVRKFDGPSAPKFIRLDAKPGLNPPVAANGNYLIGPEYQPAPENKANPNVPQGKIHQFKIDSRNTKLLNPGIARKVFGTVDPNNPKTLKRLRVLVGKRRRWESCRRDYYLNHETAPANVVSL